MKQLAQIGRLAMRVEGDFWVAYYALPNTMDGAIRLGDLRMEIARNEVRKNQFMDFMREIVSDLIEAASGHRPTWNEPREAPEHEKAGRA